MIRTATFAAVLCLSLTACESGDAPAAADAAAADAAADTATSDAAVVAPDGPGVAFPENGALRLSANPAAPSAAYFTLVGNGQSRMVTAITSPDAERIEMHETRRENEMTVMAPVEQIEIPADGSISLVPGGYHLMIFGVSDAARAAGSINLVVQFADGTSLRGPATTANMAAWERQNGMADEDHSGH